MMSNFFQSSPLPSAKVFDAALGLGFGPLATTVGVEPCTLKDFELQMRGCVSTLLYAHVRVTSVILEYFD